jgi:hypothetical protein
MKKVLGVMRLLPVDIACVALLLTIIFSCTTRYVTTSEYGDSNATSRVLIATTSTDFKDVVIEKVSKTLAGEGIYVKVIDLKTVDHEESENFDAIMLVSTLHYGYMDGNVSAFLSKSNTKEKSKIIVLTTSGDQDWKAENLEVDAISSASRSNNISPISNQVVEKIRQKCKILPVNQ